LTSTIGRSAHGLLSRLDLTLERGLPHIDATAFVAVTRDEGRLAVLAEPDVSGALADGQ